MKNSRTFLLKILAIIGFAQNTAYGNNFPEIENVTGFIMKYVKKSRTLFLLGDHWKSNLENNYSRTEDTAFNAGLHEKANSKCLGWDDIIMEGELSGRFKIDKSGKEITIHSHITIDGDAFENELSPSKNIKFKKEMNIRDSNSQCKVISRIKLAEASKITFDCETTLPYERGMFR